MKILHLFPSSFFTYDFIQTFNRCFNDEGHYFIIFGLGLGHGKKTHEDNKLNIQYSNVIFCENLEKNIPLLRKELYACDKIILHSLHLPRRIIAFFSLQPWYWKKYIWFLWSGDLYSYLNVKTHSTQEKIDFKIYKLLVKNLNTIAALCYGDYQLAKKYFQTKASFRHAVYPVQLIDLPLNAQKFSLNKGVTIQIGNAPSDDGQHYEVFRKLIEYRNDNIRVVCPLSYEHEEWKEYKKQVIYWGDLIFGSKFVPLTEPMKYEKYFEFLNTVDIAVFHHKFHRGVGNILALLYLGKKVYLNDQTTVYKYFRDNQYIIFRTKDIPKEDFYTDLTLEEKQHNRDKSIHLMSDENFTSLWKNVTQ